MEIVVECNPDEALMRALGYPRKMVFHQSSKAEVLRYLEKNPTSIGIVDEDPGRNNAGYFTKYRKQGQAKFGIEEFFNTKIKTRLIVLKPRLEEWVLGHAIASQVDPKKYSLPADGHHLHKSINEQIPKFEKMLAEMLTKKSKALLHLKQLIDAK
jgi:hypothetical protein